MRIIHSLGGMCKINFLLSFSFSNTCVNAPASALEFLSLLQHGQRPIRMHVDPPKLWKVLYALHGGNPVPSLDRNVPLHGESRRRRRKSGRFYQCGIPPLDDVSCILGVAIVVAVAGMLLERAATLPQQLCVCVCV